MRIADFSTLCGLPRWRLVLPKCNSLAACSAQVSPPKGVPRAMLWWIAVNSDSPCSALTTCTQLPASSTGKSPSIPRYALDASRWTVGWPWLATPDAGGWASGTKPAGVVRPAAQAQLQNALERQIIGGLLEQRQTHNAAIDDMVNHAWDGDAWRTRHGKRITKWRY